MSWREIKTRHDVTGFFFHEISPFTPLPTVYPLYLKMHSLKLCYVKSNLGMVFSVFNQHENDIRMYGFID